MATYIYEACNKDNKIIRGEYEADSSEDVMDYLTRHNLTPVSIKPIQAVTEKKDLLAIQ